MTVTITLTLTVNVTIIIATTKLIGSIPIINDTTPMLALSSSRMMTMMWGRFHPCPGLVPNPFNPALHSLYPCPDLLVLCDQYEMYTKVSSRDPLILTITFTSIIYAMHCARV